MKPFYLFLSLLIIGNLQAQTTISAGAVSGTWQKSGSPYKVNGNVYVPAGQKLSITQGVTVEFQGDYKMDVWGVIQALGKANDTVVFTAKNKTTGWTGLWVHKQASTNDSTLFDHCKFEYRGLQTAGVEPALGSALQVDTSRKIRISNSRFQKNRSKNISCGMFRSSSVLIYGVIIDQNEGLNKQSGLYVTEPSPGFVFVKSRALISNLYATKNQSNVPNSTSPAPCGILYFFDSTFKVSNSRFENNGTPGDFQEVAAAICASGNFKPSEISEITVNGINQGFGFIDASSISVRKCHFKNIKRALVFNNYGTKDNFPGMVIKLDSIFIDSSTTCIASNLSNQYKMEVSFLNSKFYNLGTYIEFSAYSKIKLENCLIGNCAIGITAYQSQLDVINSAIVNCKPNKKSIPLDSLGSGLMLGEGSSTRIYNSILAGNYTANGVLKNVEFRYDFVKPELQLTNCILDGGKSSITNLKSGVITKYSNVIESAPQFVNPTAGAGPAYDASKADWRPVNTCSVLSNTFNAGTNTISGYTFPAKDVDGNTRIANNTVDIGPYEIQKPKIPVVLKDPKDTSICANNTIDYTGLTAVADSLQYRWQLSTNGNTWANISSQNQAILYNYKPSKVGNEYLRCIVTNPICSKSDTSRTIAVNALALPTPNLGVDASIPNSGNKVLNPGTFTAYNWSTGASTPTLTVDKTNLTVGANSISVQVTGANGCKARDTIVVTLELANGLLNPSAIGIKIYPVPTSDFLNIEIPQSATTGHYQLSSMDGRILQSGSLQPNFQINVSNLSTGTYFLSMEIDGVWYGVKVVK